jgi:hypothetical protein
MRVNQPWSTIAPVLACGLYCMAAAYTYRAPAAGGADLSWLALGNGKGHLLAVETAFGLPIVSAIRSPGSGRSIVGGTTQVSVDYADSGNGNNEALRTKTRFSPSQVSFLDGMQPVVSYVKGGTRSTVQSWNMTPVSRRWVQATNIVETVTRNADFQLTTTDFVASDTNMLVRIFTVKNLNTAALPYRLIHYAPVNPSGRDLTTWVTNWQNFSATNTCAYDAGRDCITFKADSSGWWVMGADRQSSGHHCATFASALLNVAGGALNSVASAGPATVEAALSFDSTLNPGDSFTVAVYVAEMAGASSASQATQKFDAACRSRNSSLLQNTTASFWADWLNQARFPSTGNQSLVDLAKRLLVTLKACTWDIGGISAVPGELCTFYTRDGMAPALGYSAFGFANEAKRIILALEAYMTTSWNLNFQGYDSTISAKIAAGFTDATQFTDIGYFSADDPDLVIWTIGEVWKATGKTDTAFIHQTWPLVKHFIQIGQRNMGGTGTIGQNSGMQDDMMYWAYNRVGAGVECSYINMIWVTALQYAAEMATALGHAAEHTTYDSLAASIRSNIESKFWNDSLQRYAYIHDPASTNTYSNAAILPDGNGGRWIFPSSTLSEGECMAYWTGYASDAHAQTSFLRAKDRLETHPGIDMGLRKGSLVNGAGYWQTTIEITSYLYAQALTHDATEATTADWLVRNAPLAGLPEVLPTGNRGIQVWMCGTGLRAIHAAMTDLATPVVRHAQPASNPLLADFSVIADARGLLVRLTYPGTAPTAPLVVTVANAAGRTVSRTMLSADRQSVMVPRSALSSGLYVVTLSADHAARAHALTFVK